ncbi:hypothetical protein K438DRAFT_2157353 [Mycena galopus ATCC 62051]|nr:hypothetical protein K438DRAFT_2157353 [Mycena galopus ATCC 62051]
MPKEPTLPKRYLYGSTKQTNAAKTLSGCLDDTRDKENMSNPLTDHISYLETALDASEQERKRHMGLKRKLYDKHRYWEKDAVNKQQKLKDVKAIISSAPTGVPETYRHKEGSIITNTTRDCLTDLMALDHIPASRVAGAFKHVAECLGVTVEDDVDCCSAKRIQKEAGLATKLQFVEAARNAEGLTLSGDGTSHKNKQYETRNATVITTVCIFSLGLKWPLITPANHSSIGSSKSVELYQLLHDSGMATDADVREFWNLVTGFHSDHTKDQKRLKGKMEHEVRGERVLKSMGYTEVFNLTFKCGQQPVEKAGGQRSET